MYRILLCLCSLLLYAGLAAQTGGLPQPSQQQINAELARRGLTEGQVRERLREQGYDYDNVTPEQLPEVQRILQELEAEVQAAEAIDSTGAGPPPAVDRRRPRASRLPGGVTGTIQDIEESLEDGATVEEAVTEELTGRLYDSLPPPNLFGQQLYRDNVLRVYRQADQIKPGEDYVLGPGDEISIQVFGTSNFSGTYQVGTDGAINVDPVGRIVIGGLRLAQARELLVQRLSQRLRFNRGEFALTVDYARVINVGIFGEVINSGNYTISAINNAFNALAAAGGPSNNGSLRKVRINRTGGETRVVDFYDFLLKGESSTDLYLANGDFILVPAADRVVTITGAVTRPFKYELIEGEQLAELVDYAGGLLPTAYAGNIQVFRAVDDRVSVIDVDYAALRARNETFPLLRGDRVVVRNISGEVRNFVNLSGAVDFTGQFAYRPGDRISDLIERSALRDDARLDRAYLTRRNPDGTLAIQAIDLGAALDAPGTAADLELRNEDNLLVLSQRAYADRYTFRVSGAVRDTTGEYPFDASRTLRVADALELAGGLRRDAIAEGYILRENPDNPAQPEYVTIDFRAALDNPDGPDNIVLEANDRLRIFSLFGFSDNATVQVAGAVRRPGEFAYGPSLQLRDVLRLAGGLAFGAAANRIEVFRVVMRDNAPTQVVAAVLEVDDNLDIQGGGDFQLAPFDYIVVREVPDFKLQQTVRVLGEVRFPGPYPLLRDDERLSDLVERAGGVSDEGFPAGATLLRADRGIGFIVIELDKVLDRSNRVDDIVLKPGDVLTIPQINDLVTLRGAIDAGEIYLEDVVANGEVVLAFRGKQRAGEYIEDFGGGFSERADKNRVSVLYPNGRIKRTQNFLFFRVTPRVEPGAIVTVPFKPDDQVERERQEREPIDWGKVLADSLTQATSILTFILLVQRIND